MNQTVYHVQSIHLSCFEGLISNPNILSVTYMSQMAKCLSSYGYISVVLPERSTENHDIAFMELILLQSRLLYKMINSKWLQKLWFHNSISNTDGSRLSQVFVGQSQFFKCFRNWWLAFCLFSYFWNGVGIFALTHDFEMAL